MKPSHIALALDGYMHSIANDGRDPAPLGIVGPPGVGKSQIIMQLVDKYSLYFTDAQELRPGDRDPVDLKGVPISDVENMTTLWPRPDFFPPEELPEGYAHSLLLIEEYDKATAAMQNLMLQVLLDRKLGYWRLPDHTIVLFCGNNKASRAGSMGGVNWAFQNRAIWLDIEPDLEDTLAWQRANGISPLISSWLKMDPKALHDLDVKSKDHNFCSPRSLAQCDNVLAMPLPSEVRRDMLVGTIGPRGLAFNAFIERASELPANIEDCWNEPGSAMLVQSADAKWMLMDALAQHLADTNCREMVQYVSRYSQEWQARFCDEVKRIGNWDRYIKNKQFSEMVADIGHLMITG